MSSNADHGAHAVSQSQKSSQPPNVVHAHQRSWSQVYTSGVETELNDNVDDLAALPLQVKDFDRFCSELGQYDHFMAILVPTSHSNVALLHHIGISGGGFLSKKKSRGPRMYGVHGGGHFAQVFQLSDERNVLLAPIKAIVPSESRLGYAAAGENPVDSFASLSCLSREGHQIAHDKDRNSNNLDFQSVVVIPACVAAKLLQSGEGKEFSPAHAAAIIRQAALEHDQALQADKEVATTAHMQNNVAYLLRWLWVVQKDLCAKFAIEAPKDRKEAARHLRSVRGVFLEVETTVNLTTPPAASATTGQPPTGRPPAGDHCRFECDQLLHVASVIDLGSRTAELMLEEGITSLDELCDRKRQLEDGETPISRKLPRRKDLLRVVQFRERMTRVHGPGADLKDYFNLNTFEEFRTGYEQEKINHFRDVKDELSEVLRTSLVWQQLPPETKNAFP
jgi:hypothetical protein